VSCEPSRWCLRRRAGCCASDVRTPRSIPASISKIALTVAAELGFRPEMVFFGSLRVRAESGRGRVQGERSHPDP